MGTRVHRITGGIPFRRLQHSRTRPTGHGVHCLLVHRGGYWVQDNEPVHLHRNRTHALHGIDRRRDSKGEHPVIAPGSGRGRDISRTEPFPEAEAGYPASSTEEHGTAS